MSGSWWGFKAINLLKLMHQCTSCGSSLGLNDLLESCHVSFCELGSVKLFSALWKLGYSLSCGVYNLWCCSSWCNLS